MINPESLDLSALPWLPLEAKSAFPKQSAIYFAIDSLGEIQYIGRSVNPKQRWSRHHKFSDLQEIGGIRIAYLFMDADLLPSIEKALLQWFKPRLNVIGVSEPEVKPELLLTIEDMPIDGLTLKQLRERVNLKTADVASKVGVADSSVRNWEAGRTIPKLRLDQFAILCDIYGVSIKELAQSARESQLES
jgi:DNA-binding XRE family transcriptional regulator